MLGLDAWRYLTTRDPFEQVVMQSILAQAAEMSDVRDQNLAVMIANNLAKILH